MPQLSPILWELFPFVLVLPVVVMVVSLFQENEIIGDGGVSCMTWKLIEW
uniref:ATP synthase subunit 8 n=1 Tax=Calisoga longitarsis TaxID=394809 RepID=B2CKU7_9ARAC|nr:ATP synthase subunit 8 [Calisoga longitarsis]